MPPGTRCPKCDGGEFRKETDILDVWFDSGCSHAAVVETRPELRWPVEMYLEGSDQHRGWFHSSLLEAMGTRDAPPYRSVLTHGFVVDGDGRKMSKSLGNYLTMDELLPKYGAEILRLWVAAEDYTEDIRISSQILDRLSDAYRRLRNTFRFLLANLADFDPARHRRPYAALDDVDRFVLDRLGRLVARVTRAYDEYQFHTVFHGVHNFCAVDLSAIYLDVVKDRLYTSLPDDPRRRAAQTACYDVFQALVRLMAPILSFTTEEAWKYAPGEKGASVHLERFPEVPAEWVDDAVERDWNRLLEVRREAAKALETARAQGLIGSGLEASVTLGVPAGELADLLNAKAALLPTLLIVSQVRVTDAPELTVGVERARGAKCGRCWVWSGEVGAAADHPALCERCAPVVRALGRAG
jgi:isoleucyl-tRNA synthetase